jgi:hypothetical protein
MMGNRCGLLVTGGEKRTVAAEKMTPTPFACRRLRAHRRMRPRRRETPNGGK